MLPVNFYLGLGCLANWSECQDIRKELNRLALKLSEGEPLTQAEKDWVTIHGPGLDLAALKVKRDTEDPLIEGAKALLWPVLIVGAAFFLIKGKIS